RPRTFPGPVLRWMTGTCSFSLRRKSAIPEGTSNENSQPGDEGLPQAPHLFPRSPAPARTPTRPAHLVCGTPNASIVYLRETRCTDRSEVNPAIPGTASSALDSLWRMIYTKIHDAPIRDGRRTMREDLTREEVVAAIDRAVEGLLEKAALRGPPVD